MHLFKNKTKDVKQFLEEMKANKTNRSSNANTLEKKQNRPPQVVSPEPYRTEYHNSSIVQSKPQHYENHPRNSSSNLSNHDSNSSFRGSVVSNSRSMNSMHSFGQKFIAVPSQQQIFHHPQRVSQQEKNFYKTPQSVYNKPPHFPEPARFTNFEPVSEPIYNDFSQPSQTNRNATFYDLTRSHSQYQKVVQQPFNPYHSEVQQPHFQNNFQNHRNFNQFSDERRTHNFNQTTSQRSGQTNYEEPQFYQNSNNIRPQSRPPQSLINQPKPPKVQKLVQIQPFLAHQMMNNKQKSNTQFDTRSERHELQNSQPPLKKINGQRLYTSQMGQSKPQMDEISEADDCFSTENDSPMKLTDFLSKKTKFTIEEIHENDGSQEIEEQRLMEIEGQNNVNPFAKKEKTQETRPEDTQEVKVREKSLTPIKKISPFQKNSSAIKQQNVSPKKMQNFTPPKKASTPIKTKPKQSLIKISQNQKHRLQKSLHQIDQVHIKIDQFFKETSIIFSNIKRSDQNFRKMIESNPVFDKRDRKRSEANKMEIEGEEMKMNVRDAPTDKKPKQQKIEKRIAMEMNEKQTYKKKIGNSYEEIEI